MRTFGDAILKAFNALTGAFRIELSGSTLVIDGKTFGLSGGDTIRGKSADRPTATDAHTSIPYCYYYSVDTGVVSVTDGTSWVVV